MNNIWNLLNLKKTKLLVNVLILLVEYKASFVGVPHTDPYNKYSFDHCKVPIISVKCSLYLRLFS